MENISFNGEAIPLKRKRRRSNEHSVKEGEKAINIQVVVRCRARIEREIAANSPVIVKTATRELQVRLNPLDILPHKTYTFDRVFGPEVNQKKVFDNVVVPILNEVRAGYNCTLFAYGQTSTGKTFTMEGNLNTNNNDIISSDAGVIPRALHNIYETLEEESADFSVKVSYIELYNEELKDLLSSDDTDPRKLKILDDNNKKGVLHGHEEVLIQNAEHGIRVLKQGSIKRHMAQTNYNKNSSRSHSVFCITVHIKETMPDGEDLLKVGKLYLVDLAGSENISRTGAENIRAKEAGTINKSLLTLGRCINSLNEHAIHIPYRESKLTRLLQDSLGGRTKTCIIATISPAKQSYEETLSTLDYAHRAKNIQNKPVVNQRVTKKALIKEYICEIERLKADLTAAREKNGVYIAKEEFDRLVDENSDLNNKINQFIAVDNHNRNAFREFSESLLSVTSQFESKLNELKSMHIVFGESMVNKTNEFMENHAMDIAECLKYINDRLDQFDQQKDNMEHLLKTEEKASSSLYEELIKFRQETTKTLIQKEQELRTNSTTMLENLKNELSAQFDNIHSFREKIDEDIKYMVKSTQTHIDSQNRTIINNKDHTKEAIEDEKKFLMEQIQNLHGIVEEERNRRMAMQVEFIANVTAYLNNFETNQAARLKASVETVQDSISKSVNSIESFKVKNICEFEDMIKSNTNYLGYYEQQLKATKENLECLAKESNPRLVSNVSLIKKNVSSQLDTYKDTISSNMVSLDALSTNANEETTKLHRQHNQSFEELTTNVANSYYNIQSKMFNSRQELENNTKNVLELRKNNENTTNNLFNEVNNRLKRSREEINTFESDKLQVSIQPLSSYYLPESPLYS